MPADLVLRGGTLVFPDRPPEALDVLVRDGRIAALLQPGERVGEGLPVQSRSIQICARHSSRRLATVEVQHSTEPRMSMNFAVIRSCIRRRMD